jgi:ADP-ribose pyrophosphatase YjhB (NUDIX family)
LGVNVAIVQDNQVLLIKRKDIPAWGLPGGAVNVGETAAQAALRETREETGLEIALTRLVGIYCRPNWRAGGDHGILFTATPRGGSFQTVTDETVDARYFALPDLPETLLWHHYQRIVDALTDAGGVVWLQDAVWPLDDLTSPSDIQQLVKQGKFTIDTLRDQLCGRGRPEQERAEL